MRKIALTITALLVAAAARAEGSPNIDTGTVLLMAFIAIAIVIGGLCLFSAMMLAILQRVTQVRKYFLGVFLGCLISCVLGLTLFVAFEDELLGFAVFLMVVMPLAGSIIGFKLSPVKPEEH